jgi:solute carrier family 7 (L-type amino acid transporter), member 9/15
MSPNTENNDGADRPLLDDHQGPDYGVLAADERTTSPNSTYKQGTFSRNLGTSEAFAIIISIVVGSGIFTSPGSIDTNVPSPGIALVIWLVGGILAWTGATTLAELGTAILGEGLLSWPQRVLI